MKILDPGHRYRLDHLDGDSNEILQFVKRVGEKYPGNQYAYEGTSMQEVLRALIDRIQYVNNQKHDTRNDIILEKFRYCIWMLEQRAAWNHRRGFADYDMNIIETYPTCVRCRHIGCNGECRQGEAK